MSEIDDLYKSLLEGESNNEPSLSMKDILTIVQKYWNYLWSKKWIVVACGILCGLLGLLYAWNKKVNYEAHYVFTVSGSSSSSSSFGSLSSLLGISGGSMDAFSGDNVLELLKSRTLMERTLLSPVEYEGDSITFMEYALICDSVRAKCESGETAEPKEGEVSICDIHYPIGQDRETFTREQDSLLMAKASAFLSKNIETSRRDKKLSFMEYSFTHTDECFAKLFSATHLKTVTEFYLETRTTISSKSIHSFQVKADSVLTELNSTMSKRAAYADGSKNSIWQSTAVIIQKMDVQIQILSITYQELVKNIEALKLDQAREAQLIQVIDSPRYPLPNDKMRKLKGLIVGGFLGGFLSCLALLAYYYICELKQKFAEVESELPQRKEE